MSRRKRVLVVTRSTTAHPGAGGMEIVANDLLQSLSQDEFEFGLLTTPGANDEKLAKIYSRIWTVPGARVGKYSLIWWLRSASRASDWATWKPDLIFSVSSAGSSFALSPAWSNVPIVAQCHGTAWHEVQSSFSSFSAREAAKIPLNISRIFREKIAYRRFNMTVAVGPGIAQQLTDRPLSVSPNRIKIISNSVNSSDWRFDTSRREAIRDELGIPAESPVAIFSGRLHHQKGADIALHAMARLPDTRWHLIICGNGPERQRLENETSNLNLGTRVHFTGRVSQCDLKDYYSASDLMVFPTRRSEGLPMNVLEALASGLSVLTVSNANLPSNIESRVTVSTRDSDQLANFWRTHDGQRSTQSRLPSDYERKIMLGLYRDLLQFDDWN